MVPAAPFLKEGAGSHFDPACVEAFLGNWGEVIEIRARYGDADDAAADADLARAA